MRRWWWFSFSSEEGFLGGTIVDGASFPEAHQNTHRRGVNPGGGVQAMELVGCTGPDDVKPYVPYRLYSKAEMDALDGAEAW